MNHTHQERTKPKSPTLIRQVTLLPAELDAWLKEEAYRQRIPVGPLVRRWIEEKKVKAFVEEVTT